MKNRAIRRADILSQNIKNMLKYARSKNFIQDEVDLTRPFTSLPGGALYLTSFVHRDELFNIAERWFCGRCEPNDALRLTEIFICDGYVIGQTLKTLARELLEILHRAPFTEERIHFKGELRDRLCRAREGLPPRAEALFREYWRNPDYYYREAPVNGVMCLDRNGCIIGIYRIKRPARIAEKAHRYFANWIFGIVKQRATEMAEARARSQGVPLSNLFTPEEEMIREFVRAEESIAHEISSGAFRIDRAPLTINDVAGIKIIGEPQELLRLKTVLSGDPSISIVTKEHHNSGNYKAASLLLSVPWDRELICRRFLESEDWRNYFNRGIPEERLKMGLEPLLRNAAPTLTVELMLTTELDFIESEVGNCIHERRIINQRDNRDYKGYIPTNIEFLLSYLFAVGFSPQTTIDSIPIKLWGRYLPDTLSSCIRRLHWLPDFDFLF